jgi:osmotically-inducible protein OsmY
MWQQGRRRAVVTVLVVVGGSLTGPDSVEAQNPAASPPPARQSSRPSTEAKVLEGLVLQVLAANPITSPYRFTTSWRDGKVVLTGRVGTKVIHDAAVRTAGSLGVTIDDQLVIDTSEVYRSAGSPGPGPLLPSAGTGLWSGGNTWGGTAPYVYPQPLFGWYDDPFYGFEPPAISYPPYWGALSARRLDPSLNGGVPQASAQPGGLQPIPNNASIADPAGPPPGGSQPDGTVEMTIDPRGVATLRGTVPTLEDKIAVGQRLANSPNVTEVINLLNTREPAGVRLPARPGAAVPPPPPAPDVRHPAENKPAPAAANQAPAPAPIAVDDDPLTRRLSQALARRPNLAGLPIKVSGKDGIASLSGKVPSVVEAMTAFRAVQQSPGVRSVHDSLEFPLPGEDGKNPLIDQGRPDDIEPYLEAQIRRQIGDQAHIDRVRVRADVIEVRGTVGSPDDRPRVEAILRSMALLRGFQLSTELRSE